MSRGLLVFLAFLGVFVAGGVTGGLIAVRAQRSVVHQRAAETFTRQQFKRVADELDLTKEQRAHIRPIITEAGREIQERRRDILRILRQMENDVRMQLSDEQRAKYDHVRSQQREEQRSLREQRMKRLERLDPARDSSATPPAATPSTPAKSEGNATP